VKAKRLKRTRLLTVDRAGRLGGPVGRVGIGQSRSGARRVVERTEQRARGSRLRIGEVMDGVHRRRDAEHRDEKREGRERGALPGAPARREAERTGGQEGQAEPPGNGRLMGEVIRAPGGERRRAGQHDEEKQSQEEQPRARGPGAAPAFCSHAETHRGLTMAFTLTPPSEGCQARGRLTSIDSW
jgi:hypothetical protein